MKYTKIYKIYMLNMCKGSNILIFKENNVFRLTMNIGLITLGKKERDFLQLEMF